MDIMAASMKDQYFGDVDLLHQRFTTQLCKLARRWHAHGSSLLTDLRPVLTQLIDTHRSNLQDRAYWTSTSLQRSVASLSSWVVIPAENFPSRAHVICPSLFAILMHKTFCSGEVFSLCRESAASFRSEVVTTIPSLLHQRYAWGLRLQAPLPTARILPKPTKDWQKARPIISFFRTWAAPFLTVFGALIFELTKVTFPDIPGQLGPRTCPTALGRAVKGRSRRIHPPTWCLRTCPVSSRPFPRSVSIRHYRCFCIVMTK